MARACCVAILLVTGGLAAGQDVGRPFPDRTVYTCARAWVYNNTRDEIRFTVSSARGSVTGVLAPGMYCPVWFVQDGKHRLLTTFNTRTGDYIAGRFPVWAADRAYDAAYTPKFEQREVFDGGTNSVRTIQVEAPDKGKEATPPRDSVTDTEVKEP